jgi:hypothetical protein
MQGPTRLDENVLVTTRLRQIKVYQFQATVSPKVLKQPTLRLQVAVHYPSLMKVCCGARHLSTELDGLCLFKNNV